MKKKILILLITVAVLKVEAQTSTFAVSDSLFAIGRYQKALLELDNKKPSFQSNYKRAVIYESIEDFKNAAKYLDSALTFKDDYKTKLKLAKVHRRLGKYRTAIKIYESIIAKDSLNLVLKYQLGKLYILKKDGNNASKIFKSLTKSDPKNANYSYQLGVSYALLNRRDPMINSFIDTFEKDTLHFKSIASLAKSFYKLNDPDSTSLFVAKGLAINPNHFELNQLKINLFYRKEAYEEALPLLHNLDTIYPKEPYPKDLLGKIYYNLDSLDLSESYFNKVRRLDREYFKALTYLGHISLKQKKYRKAMLNYTMATYVGKERRDEEYYGLGTMYYETEKPQEAIRMFKKAVEENPRNYRALYQQAKLSDDYYKDKSIAYKLYKKYLERVYSKDKVITKYVEKRVSEIKKEYFMKGESLE